MLHVTDQPTAADEAAIRDGLTAFNALATGLPSGTKLDLAVLLRDPQRQTIGGAMGSTYYGWTVIDILWIPEALRGRDLGRRIMLAAEQEARARGCRGIRLDTFSFQARGFYEKLGYTVFGTLHDHPPGHTRYWLAKRFDEGTP